MNSVTETRNDYIGGSDVPTILGMTAKYGKSAYKLAQIKAGVLEDDFQGNEYTRYGQAMENDIRTFINFSEGTDFKPATKINLFFRGNADGVCGKRLLEIKTFGKTFDVDLYYPQIMFYMDLFDLDVCMLVGYKRPDNFSENFDPDNLIIEQIHFDNDEAEKIIKKCNSFWTAVEAMRENPKMTEQEFFSMTQDGEIAAIVDEIAVLENILADYKETEKQLKGFKQKLFDEMELRGAKSLDTGDYKITKVDSSETTKTVVDEKKLKEEFEETYNTVLTEKVSKRAGYVRITKRSA